MKRSLKSLALNAAKRRRSFSSTTLSGFILNRMKIGFDPPRSQSNYPGNAKAACVISIDFDHLTKSARSDQKRWYPEKRQDLLEKNRAGTMDLIRVSEKYEIPMTWAICGVTAEEDRSSYDSIRNSKQPQEIGVHTYSHLDVSACSDSELEADIQKCLDVLKLVERPTTFIFPWNRQGHFDLLRKLGFTAYRDQKRSIGVLNEHEGLLNIPPTYYVDQKSYGASNLIRRYLELCISWNSVFHLWLHPWSVVLPDGNEKSHFVTDTINPLFSYMQKKRDEGVLSICTMKKLSECRDQQKVLKTAQ